MMRLQGYSTSPAHKAWLISLKYGKALGYKNRVIGGCRLLEHSL